MNNQKSFVIIVLVVIIIMLVGAVGYFAFIKKSPELTQRVDTSTPTNNQISPAPDQTEISNLVPTPTPKDETAEWKIFVDTQHEFEFKYPATWTATADNHEGTSYKVIARVTNPARAGSEDTDIPVERFLVRSQNITCEGQTINLGGKVGTSKAWAQGFGNIYYRDLCFKTQEWPITLSLSAFDEPSQMIMDKILSTFKFTK